MVVQKKKRLDPLNVAYGVVAAIVILGAMFKFLNWQYANEMLFVGLTTEAIVFFISAFEMRRDDVDYSWEKVFPQLVQSEPTPIEQLDELVAKANLDPEIIERLTGSIQQLDQNVREMSDSTANFRLQQHMERMQEATERFETEMVKLNENIAKMNHFYGRMASIMENKGDSPQSN